MSDETIRDVGKKLENQLADEERAWYSDRDWYFLMGYKYKEFESFDDLYDYVKKNYDKDGQRIGDI